MQSWLSCCLRVFNEEDDSLPCPKQRERKSLVMTVTSNHSLAGLPFSPSHCQVSCPCLVPLASPSSMKLNQIRLFLSQRKETSQSEHHSVNMQWHKQMVRQASLDILVMIQTSQGHLFLPKMTFSSSFLVFDPPFQERCSYTICSFLHPWRIIIRVLYTSSSTLHHFRHHLLTVLCCTVFRQSKEHSNESTHHLRVVFFFEAFKQKRKGRVCHSQRGKSIFFLRRTDCSFFQSHRPPFLKFNVKTRLWSEQKRKPKTM